MVRLMYGPDLLTYSVLPLLLFGTLSVGLYVGCAILDATMVLCETTAKAFTRLKSSRKKLA